MYKNFEETLTYEDILLVPQYSDISSRKQTDLSISLGKNLKLQIPIIPANMDTVADSRMAIEVARLGSVCYIHRFLTIEDQVKEVLKVKKLGLLIGASIGVKQEDKKRLDALLKAGIDSILVDVAHGHSKLTGEMISHVKSKTKIPLMAGNVATPEAVKYLAKKGADIIKVGIGPGAVCTTRIVAGSGVPQFSAVLACAKEAKKYKIPIIADGGVYTSGSIVKALAAGATAVMIGKPFAGTAEAPGKIVVVNKKKFKNYRGMASKAANKSRPGSKIDNNYVAEGVDSLIPYTGLVKDLVNNFVGGIRSGLSYSGAHNISELQKKARFVRVTNAGIQENYPHGVEVI